MPRILKRYTVEIDRKALPPYQGIWYANKVGTQYITELTLVMNGSGKMAPVFKCIDPPFYHVHPIHCSIIKEETIEL